MALSLTLAGGAGISSAHPVQFTTLQVKIEPDGKFQAILNIDILAFALNKTSQAAKNEELQALLDGPRPDLAADLADADEHFKHEVVARTDVGDAVITDWTLPGMADVNAVLARNLDPRILMPGEIDFSGTLSRQATTISFRLPYVLGDTIHVYVLPGGDTYDEPVAAGGYTTPVKIDLRPPSFSSQLATLSSHLGLGFDHFISGTLDHILFTLGLFLLGNRLIPLLWQVGAFTVAHSLTLWLSSYGIIRMSPSTTGPLIAATVVIIAVENLFTNELKPWRPFVVFGCGLVHGMGFAHAFAKIDTHPQDDLPGLIGFNLGIELAQAAVILGAFLVVGWIRHWLWYQTRIARPCSGAIALTAAILTVQRIWSPS